MSAQATEETNDLQYQDALKRLASLADFERSSNMPGHAEYHLERAGLLLGYLGNPHLCLPTIHVAGTKGKGSTAAMIASILCSEGYRTGLYTSPHLHSVLERVRVGGRQITHKEFSSLVSLVWPSVERVAKESNYGPCTFFEVITAMAFLHFMRIKVDLQVVEVGLGGRLDATNVVRPEVSVVTSISLDHTATLGDTLALIAAEKAGIIKNSVPVVVAPQPDEAMKVFVRIAAEREAPIVEVERKMSVSRVETNMKGQSFLVSGLRGNYQANVPLLGAHQLENACTAIAATETLADNGTPVSKLSIQNGLERVCWPGRLQVLPSASPRVVVDGAHNPYSVKRLAEEIRRNFQFKEIVIVFGANAGHNVQDMLSELLVLNPLMCVVKSRHPRSAPVNEVSGAAKELGVRVFFESNNVGEGTRKAVARCGKRGLVLGTGSLYVVAEVTEEIMDMKPEIYPETG